MKLLLVIWIGLSFNRTFMELKFRPLSVHGMPYAKF